MLRSNHQHWQHGTIQRIWKRMSKGFLEIPVWPLWRHVNPTQRPTIMIDMEFALVGMIKKANNQGCERQIMKKEENSRVAFRAVRFALKMALF